MKYIHTQFVYFKKLIPVANLLILILSIHFVLNTLVSHPVPVLLAHKNTPPLQAARAWNQFWNMDS